MKRPEIISIDPEVLKYIEYMEGCLNGSSELILALNTASRVFASDLNIICGEGDEYEAFGDLDLPKTSTVLLSADAKDKTFERIMILFDKFDKIKALSQHFKGNEQAKSAAKLPVKVGGNAFEHVIRDIKKNGNSRI